MDVGFNMWCMRPLRIDSQIQNVGKNSGAGGFPRKTLVSQKKAFVRFDSFPLWAQQQWVRGRLKNFHKLVDLIIIFC
jgi:hypothetical protein